MRPQDVTIWLERISRRIRMKTDKKKDDRIIYIISGCVLVILSMIPFFIMGENSIITYHDQLDGEMITYILNAKHLTDGLKTYPELMNGIPAAGMMSPAPFSVLFFKFFSPFTSFILMMFISKTAAFLSLFLLCERVTKKNWVAFMMGMIFMMLPFYPVYGLSITGQAFIWYAFIVLSDKESTLKEKISCIILTFVYSIDSSLALVGYALIIVSLIISIIMLIKRKRVTFSLIIPAELIVGYSLVNLSLISQMLNIGYNYTSHKTEMICQVVGFFNTLKGQIMGEDTYTNCYQWLILIITIVFLSSSFIITKNKKEIFKKNKSILIGNVVLIIAILIFVSFYGSAPVVAIRNNSSGFVHDFNFGRFSWMLPVAWFLLLAQSISIFIDSFSMSKKPMIKLYILPIVSSVILFCIAGFHNDVKPTVMRMIKGSSYRQITYRQFYSTDLFNEVDRLIGKKKEDYRVISLCLHPACAAYNGFFCLDAYSNNYDVEYKKKFRNIISYELDKSEYYTSYFDNWGNRCYAFLANYSYIKNDRNDNTVLENIDIDFSAAKNMGAEYVISAFPIINEESLGLILLNDTPITSDDAWYDLYVYEIN